MRIALLLPGSGTRFYCENCARDGDLAVGMQKRGHDVAVYPLYLPLSNDKTRDRKKPPVYYGAVGIYLKQRIPTVRKLPSWVTGLLDSGPVLRIAGGLAGSTDAVGLGDLTLSMLRGEEGNQRRELEHLVDGISDFKPDVVHLSNGLLAGLARPIRKKLGVPVACSLQDEDGWVDTMDGDFADKAWKLMRERCADIDLFLPVSRYYADRMKDRLGIEERRMLIVPVGVPECPEPERDLPLDPPVIGYLSHMTESMGLGLLVDAYILLRKRPAFRRLRLKIAGGAAGADQRFVRTRMRKLSRVGATADVSIGHAFQAADRRVFLSSLSLLSVPVLRGEAYGTFLIEAMACGVPVVQPALGGFPEVVEATGGGVLYEPNTAEALAEALGELLGRPETLRKLGQRGRETVGTRYTLDGMIDTIERAYQKCAMKEWP